MYGLDSDFDHGLRLDDLENRFCVGYPEIKFYVDSDIHVNSRRVWQLPVKEAWGVSVEEESSLQSQCLEDSQVTFCTDF